MISRSFARFFNLIKWPTAVVMVALIVPAFWADIQVFKGAYDVQQLAWSLIPCAIAVAMWLFIFPDLNNSFLNTFDHELTHLIFAVLTGNRPTDLDVGQGDGCFSFKGHGHWLITIAPYFFPLFPVAIIAGGLFYPIMQQPIPDVYWAIYGTSVGMHIGSTIGEIRENQTDLRRVGFLFAFCFLPAAHLIGLGFLFSFAGAGFDGFGIYLSELIEQVRIFAHF